MSMYLWCIIAITITVLALWLTWGVSTKKIGAFFPVFGWVFFMGLFLLAILFANVVYGSYPTPALAVITSDPWIAFLAMDCGLALLLIAGFLQRKV